jgi:hypothetical protein
MKRRANKKKGSSSHAASTSASKSLKLVLPARCNNTEISSIPPVKVAEVDAVSVQQGPEPATAISPVSDPLPAVVVKPTMVDNIPLTRVEAIEQDIEIVGEPVANIDYSYDPVTPPALKLLADFYPIVTLLVNLVLKITNSLNYGTNPDMQIVVPYQVHRKERDKDPQHCPSLQGHGTLIQTAECNA